MMGGEEADTFDDKYSSEGNTIDLTKKEAEDINKMIMKVDDMELDGLERKRKEELRSVMLRVKRKMAVDKKNNGS